MVPGIFVSASSSCVCFDCTRHKKEDTISADTQPPAATRWRSLECSHPPSAAACPTPCLRTRQSKKPPSWNKNSNGPIPLQGQMLYSCPTYTQLICVWASFADFAGKRERYRTQCCRSQTGFCVTRKKHSYYTLFTLQFYRRSAGDRPPLVNGRVWGAKTQNTEKRAVFHMWLDKGTTSPVAIKYHTTVTGQHYEAGC